MLKESAKDQQDGVVVQPYLAFVAKEHYPIFEDQSSTLSCMGCVRNGEIVCYFTVVLVPEDSDRVINRNAVYLSDSVIRQLKLSIKQCVVVQLDAQFRRNRIDGITFYSFANVSLHRFRTNSAKLIPRLVFSARMIQIVE